MKHLLPLALCVLHAAAGAVTCSVAVDYRHDGAVVSSYQRDFDVNPGADYLDDFSTPTRQGQFRASAARQGAATVVSIDYFADVDTFDAMSFDSLLTVPPGRRPASISGGHGFSTSLGVAGNHQLSYTLACR